MKNKMRFLAAATGLAMLLFMGCLAACGSENADPSPTQAPNAAATAAPTEEAPTAEATERQEVSRVPIYDCDGSGHGYYEITYSDGSTEYVDF